MAAPLAALATSMFTIALSARGDPTPGPLSGRLFWTSTWLTSPSPGHCPNNCLSTSSTHTLLLVLCLFQIPSLCPIFFNSISILEHTKQFTMFSLFLSPSLGFQSQEARGFCLFHSRLYSRWVEPSLAHSRCSVIICRRHQW